MLGPLEIRVMEVLWTAGQSSVRDVVEKLERKLAYTTVMTTLDRLFKKGMLDQTEVGARIPIFAASVQSRVGAPARRRPGGGFSGRSATCPRAVVVVAG